ncbi:MAG TPA: tRNA (adenosine(37)-N6)-threonylcarbamoyltransferase complex ATPase subunit type 1 TsaE [Gammaproteobacteria bacterium]|nr:tRNA (adenosine(37)-N6)-threonylcarbamoyltransferase complex ATPase subunit type 1 TsaE [Gammaproteobacteria bacterium]
MQTDIPDVTAMEELAGHVALLATPPLRIHLQGQLGAGKTTFVRGFLRQLGYTGIVKSPTYTLVEPYTIDTVNLYHFDLYRLNSPAELEDIGLRDYLGQSALYLVEWPEKAASLLGPADLMVQIEIPENPASGRCLRVFAQTPKGDKIIHALSAGL